MDLLEKNSGADAGDALNAQIIHDTLAEFNIEAAMGDINAGPRYAIQHTAKVKLTRITALKLTLRLIWRHKVYDRGANSWSASGWY